ncbi:AAA family ATPase [Aphanothece sacrum]|uniref:Endonuclease GajA/Old nuclease/RecF-like AAA domain-containing protein n=1 Tax=Aphanothece sacrum FPU1 TaxID=1920663 RepID=A0A401IE83_APHSA|nr:AAA family ATPase [Aphanothece sacrum]GBF79573.1 hypothetical protein AsFPU1_0969 [Aphanothece sacrum FPU1]GBF87032.1 hypothetical protein AsFPU3_4111 [Aphanothece sacrum FPU3]
MLRDLTIKNYRCFEDFSVNGLAQVNLIVGNNNNGKTTFLEAIYLLTNQQTSKNIEQAFADIFQSRNEFINVIEEETVNSGIFVKKKSLSINYLTDYLFYNFDRNNQISIYSKEENPKVVNIVSNNGSFYFYLIYNKQENTDIYGEFIGIFNNKTGEVKFRPLALELDENPELSNYLESSLIKRDLPIKNDNKSQSVSLSQLVSTRQKSHEEVAKLWDQISMTLKEKRIIEALNIIHPDIERIGFTVSQGINQIRLKLKDQDQLIPLGSLGEGINKILTLAMFTVTSENGVLLIDEIETGLHYEAQIDMWRLLIQTAQELNVQIFATTHSWDCISAFQEALQDIEDKSVGKLFRLDNKYGKIRAVEYKADEISIAVRQGIEVR